MISDVDLFILVQEYKRGKKIKDIGNIINRSPSQCNSVLVRLRKKGIELPKRKMTKKEREEQYKSFMQVSDEN